MENCMNTIRRHLSLLLPLLGLLFSLQSVLLINRAITFREESLLQNYSIIIASKKELKTSDLAGISRIASLDPLDSGFLLERFKDFDENIDALKSQLPLFYSIKLSYFPSNNDLKNIENKLKNLDFISHFETFAKTHGHVSKLLYFIKQAVVVFGVLLFALSFLLMLRVVQVWRFEHQKRMEIMSLLGASFWLKNKVLFQLAFIDSLIASVGILIITFIFSIQDFTEGLLDDLGVSSKIFAFFSDFALLFGVSILVCLICVILAIIFRKRA